MLTEHELGVGRGKRTKKRKSYIYIYIEREREREREIKRERESKYQMVMQWEGQLPLYIEQGGKHLTHISVETSSRNICGICEGAKRGGSRVSMEESGRK